MARQSSPAWRDRGSAWVAGQLLRAPPPEPRNVPARLLRRNSSPREALSHQVARRAPIHADCKIVLSRRNCKCRLRRAAMSRCAARPIFAQLSRAAPSRAIVEIAAIVHLGAAALVIPGGA